MAYKFQNTRAEINYLITGTENPKFLSEREKGMIDKFVKLLDEERENNKKQADEYHRLAMLIVSR